MAQRTRADSPTKVCTLEECDRPLRAKGMCSVHYNKATQSKRMIPVECPTCGTVTTKRDDGARLTRRFCSLQCRDVWRREQDDDPMWRSGICRLPSDHPVRGEIARQRAADRPPRVERIKVRPAARECPACGAWFSPRNMPHMICCSKACTARMARRRRRAREHGALGSWVWSDFMRIAQRFGFRCAYCDEKPTGQLDPDHVVPLSRGGYDSVANLLPACRACNCDKRDLLLGEWNADRERRGLPPRLTTWAAEDRRFRHLTQALLISPAA